MAIESGFFTSSGGDRRYKAEAFTEYFASFVGNGVLPSPFTMLQVVEAVGMTVNVLPGKAFINGHYLFNSEAYPLALAAADGVYSRIDRIVARLDLAYRSITIAVKTGIAGPAPIAPALVRDDTVHELSLAKIMVAAGVTEISQAVIEDTRTDDEECGLSTMLPKGLDVDGMFAQYAAEWQNFKDMYISDEGLGAAVLHFNEVADQINGSFDIIKNTSLRTAAGTATALAVSVPLVTEYTPEAMYWVMPSAANNAAATTININGLGTLPLYKVGTTTAPALKANTPFLLFISADAAKAYFIKTGGSTVRVQRGTVTLTPNGVQAIPASTAINISAVDVTKSIVSIAHNGFMSVSASAGFDVSVGYTLASTVLTLTTVLPTQSSSTWLGGITITWEVATFED